MNNIDFIPQVNPKAGYLAHKDEIDTAIRNVLESGWYILGQEVGAFEKEFASYIGVAFGIGVASGTDALEISLRALDIGPGDLVFTVSHTAVATVAAIVRCGATPVLVDIEQATFTMNPDHLERTIKSINNGQSSIKGRPRAVIPVHLYGHPADVVAIMDIAQKYHLYVIEDCAQADGAEISGQKVGSFGQMAAFSFYPTKNLGAFGDGGMVVTNSQKLQQKLLALRQYGWEKRYVSSMPGINSRLDELQAAISRVKLGYLKTDNIRRRKIAKAYTQAVVKTKILAPQEAENITHVYHQYVVRIKERDSLIQHFKKNSITIAIHYPMPVHLQPAYKDRINIGKGGLPLTEKVCQEIVSLPMFPQMTDAQVERVVKVLLSWQE